MRRYLSFAPPTAGLAAQHEIIHLRSAAPQIPDEAPIHFSWFTRRRPALSVPFQVTRRCQNEAVCLHTYAAGYASGDAERRARAKCVSVDHENTEETAVACRAFCSLEFPVILLCCGGRAIGKYTRRGGGSQLSLMRCCRIGTSVSEWASAGLHSSHEARVRCSLHGDTLSLQHLSVKDDNTTCMG